MSNKPHAPVSFRHHFQIADSAKDPVTLLRLWVSPVRIYAARLAASGRLVQVTEFRNEGAFSPADFLRQIMLVCPGCRTDARHRELILTETPLAILPQAWVQEVGPATAAQWVISPQASTGNVMFFPEPQSDWGALLLPTRNWTDALDEYWPHYQVRHAAGLIWESMQALVSQELRTMWVHVLEDRTLLIAAREGSTLRLLNAYPCRDEADRPYYVQAVREVLGWENEEVHVLCAGELDQAPPPGWLQWEGLRPAAPRSLLRPWPNALSHSPWWRFICLLASHSPT